MTRRLPIASVFPILIAVFLLGPSGADAFNLNHDCTFCHSIHAPPGQTLLNDTVVETLCLSCHGPAGIATLKADVHQSQTCTVCHSTHSNMENWTGGINLKLVGTAADSSGFARIDSPSSGPLDVVFESLGSDESSPTLHSFADDNEDGLNSPLGYAYDGVCEICHNTTGHHRSTGDPTPHHAIGRTCTSCHAHDAGFSPAGGNCIDCHSNPQDNGDNVPPGGRRAVVGEFALTSHHADSVTSGDCEVCHEMTQHQAGRVRLFDVDDPGNPALVVELLGDPATNATEAAKLEPFCLACHDDNGANGSAPFSDGQMPPSLDSASWTGSSHDTGGISCFGDGSTFGCHSTGHGSQKQKILAPYNVAATPPANAEEQEGFCFNCHDSDGPAGTDIQGLFALTTHHLVAYADQNGNGRDAECTVCHNQHYVTQAVPRTNSNIASGLISTVGGVDATGTSISLITYEYELCFLCHSAFAGAGNNPGDGGADPVANKLTQFDTGNATFHPVRGPQDNPYAAAHWDNPDRPRNLYVTMEPPWNQVLDEHNTMWCSDCHESDTVAGPHGSDTTKMLKAGLSPAELVPGDGKWYTPLCVQCHKYSVYVDGAAGSRFSAHNNNNHRQPDWTGGPGGCLSCHYGGISPMTGIHGGANDGNGNGGTIAPGYMNGSRLVNWSPGSCEVVSGGDSGCGGHTKSY